VPTFQTFEVISAYVHRTGFNGVVVVVYRPGSQTVTQAFLDDFSDLLERLSTYSSPLMIVGDFNIHVDDPTDTHAGKLLDVLTSHSLQQNVKSPTHRHGHTLDLVITRDDQAVKVLPVDPPLLSDHSFVVVDCSRLASPDAPSSTSKRYVRNWRTLDVDAFVSDLQTSDLVVSLPDDVVAAFECYTQHCERCWTNTPLSS